MTEAVIELNGLCKNYAKRGKRLQDPTRCEQPAGVCDLTLSVRRGEVLALLGPSGCGKSTTLRLIAGLEAPDSGEIAMDGSLVAGRGRWVQPEARRIGLVFQDYALFPHLTVAKNIAFPLNRLPARERQERVAEMLDLVGLSGYENRYPHQLSGGQQQRVALARALAPRPSVVLLDEPFSSLDADSRVTVREQVRTILKSVAATVIFVTHDQEEALYMGDRVAVMNCGRLEQVGTPEELFEEPATRFVAEFLGLPSFLPGVVIDGGLQTEIGCQSQPLEAPPGTPIEVLVRPDDLTLSADPAGDARVVRSVFRGMDYLYDVALPSGRVVRCLGAHTARHEPGTAVYVTLSPGHKLACFRNKDERCDLCTRLNTNAECSTRSTETTLVSARG
jgi:iron(III) transport system ATP-binding protein